MRLFIEYDPFVDAVAAKRAADALTTLGMPAELREVRPTRGIPEACGPITFEGPAETTEDSMGNDPWLLKITRFLSNSPEYVLVHEVLGHLGRPCYTMRDADRVARILHTLGYEKTRVLPKDSDRRFNAYVLPKGKGK